MASKSRFSFLGLAFLIFTLVALVLLLCLLAMQENPDGVIGYGCYYGGMEKQNRKLLNVKEVAEGGLKQNMEGSELRMVPSGPDPLHHNSNPKKPQTP